ncbi:sigma-70 family RNA polymerase sigma factor [Singulisphaera sp. PoT]|uniref:sigma-70 family RNA polymerase sigma factor n=1 Tax=Singulisphaera sp. PoT TaxID=3411797 RepID=UPI003BF5FF69
MEQERTTYVVQRYLDELADARPGSDAELVISSLLGRSARRLERLCAGLLYRRYPRLAQPPLGLGADEMLQSIVERLLRALRETRPTTVRGFFGLASQHMRWELNDLARRLDEQIGLVDFQEVEVAAPPESESGLPFTARRMLEAIENLPEDEREVLDVVRIHGMTHVEAAELLDISLKTVQRRLHRALFMLADELKDLDPNPGDAR